MNFSYKKECSVKVGQKLYGIIAVSLYTYDGVYPVIVDEIDYTNEEIIFKVDQPCLYVSCDFREMEYYVFENEVEAKNKMHNLDFGEGLQAYE